MSDAVHRRLIGRRCNSLLVYEAHDSSGLVDGAAMIVLGLDDSDGSEEWVRVFFDVGGWSWTTTNEPVPAPEDPTGELRFPSTDLAALLGVAGTEIRLAELVPRAETAARFLLGFATGVMVSVEHDGDRTHLQIIPPAA
jgi:hypothetical protein